jgi:ATPase family associated with various cellular activities (AAA)
MDQPVSAFDDVPRDARGHLGLLFYAAAYHLVYHLRCRSTEPDGPLEQVLNLYPFLGSYFSRIRDRLPEDIEWGESIDWLRGQIERWENAAAAPLPILEMRRVMGLPYFSALVFVLAGMVEEEAQFARLFSIMDQPRGEHRASVAIAQGIFEGIGPEDSWQLTRPLVDSGFLQVMNPEEPRSEWVLRVPPPLWSAVRGESVASPLPGTFYQSGESLPALAELVVDPAAAEQLTQLQNLAQSGRTQTLIVRGMPGTDRAGVAGAIARELGYGLLEIECTPADSPIAERWRLVGPLCTLARALPAFRVDAGPGETFEIPPLAGWGGPTAVLIGREGGVGGQASAHALSLHLELESPGSRLDLWKNALNGCAPAELSEIAARFCLPGRYIRQCARLAIDYASVGRRTTVSLADVRQAARAINRQMLDTLAARIDGPANWPHLVARDATVRELHVLEGRCRHRERLAETFGSSMPGGLNRGVRALFEGPSGTGKTLAARVLANELGLDLYRVDLSAVVNKYVGETEKNLSRVLGRAEDLNVILLLDEGDSLMTRRTDVKSSNDRYANLETNYLLQRLETYTGIVIVTTNAGHSIDSAFRRRMDAVIKFHLPDAAERLLLWQAHLPHGHEVSPAALEETAVRYQFTGGQIRNITVRAALLSLGHNSAAVQTTDLKEAIQAEHRKAGATFIEGPAPVAARNDQSLSAFVGGLS